MEIEPFALERWQSIWENRVAWNLAESGVHPLRVEEVATTDADRQLILRQELGYSQTNGTPELREAIAQLYPEAGTNQIEVTNGGSEANCIVMWHLVEPGDEVIMMTPNYMQIGGIARALGAVLVPWPMVEEETRWRADLSSLERLVTSRTKVIALCNPNNPTGARMTSDELNQVCDIAKRSGSWIIADEIYRGAELDSVETPTMWGRYERVIVTSGLSKAYGMPGLRVGWVAGPVSLVEAVWGVHDYTSIAPGAVNDRLARIALARRELILARTRGIISANYPVVRNWIEKRAPKITHIAPEAGAILFARYRHAINSIELVERIREQKSVLVVPGDHFEMDGFIRIGFGDHPGHVTAALDLVGEVMDEIP